MQSKLINLSEIVDDVSCEDKDQTLKTLRQQFSCRRKCHIGRHLRQHCRLPPPIPMADYSTSICPFESGNCGKGKNYKNLNISRTKRAF